MSTLARTPETFNIEAFLAQEASKDLLRLSTAGSVDDGKSTLIGRLLHDARGAYEDQLQSAVRGGEIDFALLTDGLRAEREQGITIDVAYRYFATPKRKFILADTPGHEQYTRNMATGASTAELVIILLDAHRGMTVQSRRHGYIAALLGIPHFVIAVNKMDLVGYEEAIFRRIQNEYQGYLDSLGVQNAYFLPISALKGDNVVEPSRNMPWFRGPSLLTHLESVDTHNRTDQAPLRMPVQRVSRPDMSFRGFQGQISSGVVRPGDRVKALPSGRWTQVTRVVTYDGDLDEAYAPMSVTLTLADEIDISRGDMLVAGEEPQVARAFEATLVWFDAHPLDTTHEYLVKHTTQTVQARVEKVKHLVNVAKLETEPASSLAMNEIGVVRISTARPLFFDPYRDNRATGSFILIDRKTNATAGAGMILGAVEGSAESGQDRLVRLVRQAVGEDVELNLPADDAQAVEALRAVLKGVIR
jgi:sulfate adenylyltransferase large subunit